MLHFDNQINAVLLHYHERMKTESERAEMLSPEERMSRVDEFLLPVGEETGVFLNTLAKAAKSKLILEIGTSYGYSTVWLAEAAKTIGGKVITLEVSADKAHYAIDKLAEAGLSAYVDFRVGDALQTIKQATETFDFVLVDVWKELYVPCFDLFFPKLNPGAWVVADNMIFPPHSQAETTAYRNRVKATGAFDTLLLPIGSGIELSYRLAETSAKGL